MRAGKKVALHPLPAAAAVTLLLLAVPSPARAEGGPRPSAGAPAAGVPRPSARPAPPSRRVPPPPRAELRAAVEGAVSWLVKNQNRDGSWGTFRTRRTYEVLAMVPGSHHAFRVATTALCVIALEDSPVKTEAGRAAASRGIDYLLGAYNVKRPRLLEHYSVWAFGYTSQCFGRWLLDHPDDPRAERIRAAAERLVVKLGRYQSLDGGWGYLSMRPVRTYRPSDTSMSFTTGAILVGIDRLQRAGVEVPGKMVQRAVKNVAGNETPLGAFSYGDYLKERPLLPINRIKGSACRTPCCLYALSLFGRKLTVSKRCKVLDDLLVRHIRFQELGVRRPVPHESWYQISGYFYLFGMAYAGYILEGLPPGERQRFAGPLFAAVMYCRQPDGSFWDYPLYGYHKAYGTAFALMALSRIPGAGAEAEE